jgi:CRISPR-associated protein Cmr1
VGKQFEIELITPLFGGGVQPRTNDLTLPIRATSIRGQLQFWWRATVGAQYASPKELREAQSALWGNTKQASRVHIRVEEVQVSQPVPCAVFEQEPKGAQLRSMPTWQPPFRETSLPYALFPFQGELARDRRQVENPPAKCVQEARFRLVVVAQAGVDLQREVEPAVWAWVHFGGLGSRTRRGCGAVRCPACDPGSAEELTRMWQRLLPEPRPARAWPTLKAVLAGAPAPRAIQAWDQAVRLLRDFRQGVDLGRNSGQTDKRPGRSRWPEPETIRRVTGQRSRQHPRLAQIPDDAFPRAEFGLPIVFHFKDGGKNGGDPPDTVLFPGADAQGQRRNRMASPLILKPLALKDGTFLPLIVQLQGPPLREVDLRQDDRSLKLPQPTLLRDAKLSGYPNSPLQGRSEQGSAVEAFLAYAASQGLKRVVG